MNTKQDGMEFTATVNLPAGYGFAAGKWEFVQVVCPSWGITIGGVAKHSSLNGLTFGPEGCLDTSVPYGFQAFGQNGPAGWFPTGEPGTAADSPSINLVNNTIAWTNNESYRMYIMFLPAGDNSKWVPLQYAPWTLTGTATLNGRFWNLTNILTTNPGVVVTSPDFPQWNTNASAGTLVND
jgi:hypothetical protein